MGRKKKKTAPAGRIISVRVCDDEMESFREIMTITRKSASSVMRQALRLYIAELDRRPPNGLNQWSSHERPCRIVDRAAEARPDSTAT